MRRLSVTGVALATAVLVAMARLLAPSALALMDAKVLDLRFGARGALAPGGRVVLVAIDQKALDTVGRWPWPRERLGELVRDLTAAHADVIGLDIVFDLRDPTGDDQFAAAIRESGRVVLGHFFQFDPELAPAGSQRFPELGLRETPGARPTVLPGATSLRGNIPVLADAAAGLGHLNCILDRDGACRRVPLVVRQGERMAPAFALELLRLHLRAPTPTVQIGPDGVESLNLGSNALPVTGRGELWVNWLGPPPSLPRVSAGDVFAGRLPPTALAGRVAIVGVVETAYDRLSSPFASVVPGAELHATVVDNVLTARTMSQPMWPLLTELASILLAGAAVALVLRTLRGVAGTAGCAVLVFVCIWGVQRLFAGPGVLLGTVYPLSTLALCTLAGLAWQYGVEEREGRRVRNAFRHYVNPEVTELIAREPERLRLGGERRLLSVLFTDIRGFTTVSENLAPEALGDLLNRALGVMTDAVFQQGGLLDKYIGDAVMAFWGAPVPSDDHAARACRAALDIRAGIAKLSSEGRERGWPPLAIGAGVATGEAVVGNFGSRNRFAYTAVGDTVNLASRLEGLNKLYGTTVLVADTTRRALGDEFVCREIDLVRVKGKMKPVAVYEVLGLAADDADGMLARRAAGFEAALAAYRARAWDEALQRLDVLAREWPQDRVLGLYTERCRTLRATAASQDWDGVFEATEK